MTTDLTLFDESPDEVIEGEIVDMVPALDVEAQLEIYGKFLDFIRAAMKPGVDYGVVPGTGKDTLFKPGAEKFQRFFGFSVPVELVEKIEQWDVTVGGETFPLFSYTYVAKVYDKNGRLLTTCEGNANSYEKKWRWRWVDEAKLGKWAEQVDNLECEESTVTEFAFAIEKAETSGQYGKPQEYWDSLQEQIDDGTAIPTTRKTRAGKELEAYTFPSVRWQIPNTDIHSQINTLMKMAQKRAYVGAIILAANASEYFTQDLEDLDYGVADPKQTIYAFVPERKTSAQHLQAYFRSLGVKDPGHWIKKVMEDNEFEYPVLEPGWKDLLDLLYANM